TEAAPHDAAEAAARFADVFADLRAPHLEQKLESFYAPDLWFNDTLATITNRDDLVRYMLATGEKVESMDVQILDAFSRGPDVFMRWGMQLEFKAGWRTARTDTVGMTHLRFNDDGQVILHQDFWDNAEGIFREVPLVRRAVALETFE
ncbi:MAG: nuclear transport factor 2 family protein, partial [Xanthomonadales bacterium]|nr:nuclear transport factor 2 family protein [Xanthomonadales bacterium]